MNRKRKRRERVIEWTTGQIPRNAKRDCGAGRETMGETESTNQHQQWQPLATCNEEKDFLVSGRLVFVRDKGAAQTPESLSPAPVVATASSRQHLDGDGKLLGFPVIPDPKVLERRSDLEQAPLVLSLEELARHSIEGLDYSAAMDQLADLGPEGRIVLYYRKGKLFRHEVFEDPRVCKDVERGAVVHNLEQKAQDVSGWRVHEFYIDSKGCLGEICTRCVRVCPESAIHLRGDGATSFCEIDPAACKGCFICWVECTRKAADCIMIDGKVFDSQLRAAHFGE